MNPHQYTIITTLAIAAGASILFFDGSGKAHRPGASLTAWLMFILVCALAGAAIMRRQTLTEWLLIFIFALNVGTILIARGNINKLATRLKKTEAAPKRPAKPHIRPNRQNQH